VYLLRTSLFIKVDVKRTVPRAEMSSKDGPKTRKIFVGGIPPSLTEGYYPSQILLFLWEHKLLKSLLCSQMFSYNHLKYPLVENVGSGNICFKSEI
jgi:hypothetical protein